MFEDYCCLECDTM